MNLSLPDHLVQPITSALRYGIADLQQAVTRDSPEVQQTVKEWQTALALVARIQPVEDATKLRAALDAVRARLPDPHSMVEYTMRHDEFDEIVSDALK